jgi:hypothetical protein
MRILRGLGSRSLPCGCLVGIYETYDGKAVALVDARGSSCSDTRHRVDATVATELVTPLRQPSTSSDGLQSR